MNIIQILYAPAFNIEEYMNRQNRQIQNLPNYVMSPLPQGAVFFLFYVNLCTSHDRMYKKTSNITKWRILHQETILYKL